MLTVSCNNRYQNLNSRTHTAIFPSNRIPRKLPFLNYMEGRTRHLVRRGHFGPENSVVINTNCIAFCVILAKAISSTRPHYRGHHTRYLQINIYIHLGTNEYCNGVGIHECSDSHWDSIVYNEYGWQNWYTSLWLRSVFFMIPFL